MKNIVIVAVLTSFIINQGVGSNAINFGMINFRLYIVYTAICAKGGLMHSLYSQGEWHFIISQRMQTSHMCLYIGWSKYNIWIRFIRLVLFCCVKYFGSRFQPLVTSS